MKAQVQLLIYPYTPIFTFLNLDTAWSSMLCKSGQMVSPPTIKKVWMQRTSAEEINMHPLCSL